MSLEHQKKYKSERRNTLGNERPRMVFAGVIDQQPKIALCVLIEHGHHGSSAAAPFAKQIIEFFYNKEDKKEVQIIAKEEGVIEN